MQRLHGFRGLRRGRSLLSPTQSSGVGRLVHAWTRSGHTAAAAMWAGGLVAASLALAPVGAGLVGCEGGHEDFLACKLDPILLTLPNAPCTDEIEGVGTQETCVVDPHPQCPTDICITWSGSGAFCTQGCNPDPVCPQGTLCPGNCPGGSVCAGYGVDALNPAEPAGRYCIKIDALVCESDADCPGSTCPPVAGGTRRCAAPID